MANKLAVADSAHDIWDGGESVWTSKQVADAVKAKTGKKFPLNYI